jgi:two-component system sensor histidine kinase/response regulator
MMGGEIWFESEEGLGSRFHFTITTKLGDNRSNDKIDSNEELVAKAVEQLKGAHLLLVEDIRVNQMVAMRMLAKYGITNVQIALNGQEALEMVQQHNFDGVLMDCLMPIMDGYDATRLIREQEKFKDLPIIAMTANVMTQDIEQVLEVGMNDHIAKPIDPKNMLITMAKWIKK